MAKKEKRELTPEEKAEKLERKLKKRKLFGDTFFKALAVILTLALIFSVAYIAFSRPVIITQTEYVGGTGSSSASSSSSTTPASTTPSSSSSTTPASTDNNGGSSTPASTDNNGGSSEAPASNDPATVAGIINKAMAAAANAGYTWSRTGNITELNVPSKDTLNGIINKVSEGSTVDSVVGGFLGAKGNTETLTISAGQTPLNEKGDDKYYHWDHYKIIATSVTGDDLQNLQVNGNEYTFTLAACQNPQPGSAGFSRFSNDYVTLDEVNKEIKANVSVVSVSDMTATFGPMNVKMTIENGKVTSLHYDYTASVNPMNLKATIIPISANGAMQVSADYTNFKY